MNDYLSCFKIFAHWSYENDPLLPRSFPPSSNKKCNNCFVNWTEFFCCCNIITKLFLQQCLNNFLIKLLSKYVSLLNFVSFNVQVQSDEFSVYVGKATTTLKIDLFFYQYVYASYHETMHIVMKRAYVLEKKIIYN